jgi:hypothetical protein
MSPGTLCENIKTQKYTFPAKKVLNPIPRHKRQKGAKVHTYIWQQPSKKEHHNGDAICPSSMAMVFIATPLWQPLCNGLAEGAKERFT